MAETLSLKGLSLEAVRPGIWRIPPHGKMRVEVHLVGSPELLRKVEGDRSIDQAMNVATLPGVLDPVLAMPDIHQGYGFPIGGVAAFHPETGVVSPGGVGYDINCGVRLLVSNLHRHEIETAESLKRLANHLFERIPAGVGSRRADLALNLEDFESLLTEGAAWAVARGLGTTEDLDSIEERGRIVGADPDMVSERARDRGGNQLGTLGSGNHFVEVQYVDELFDAAAAEAFGLEPGQVVVAVHTGSRGLGYQICADYLDRALAAAPRYGIELVDKELAAVPITSKEGKAYLGAMAAAANFAFANRQVITHWVREVFREHFPDSKLRLLYDVCHNIAKLEEMPTEYGRSRRVCIHRKGATRAYPPRHPLVPPRYREVGQPIFVPGDMGRASFLLKGRRESMELSFGSACHGAGRELSRHQAKRLGQGRALVEELAERGIFVRSAGRNTVLEEMPEAYKDVTEVVAATERAGIADIVARLRPMAVIKG